MNGSGRDQGRKDLFSVQIGNVTGKLSFDDMAWAKRRLTGQDLVKDVVVNGQSQAGLQAGGRD